MLDRPDYSQIQADFDLHHLPLEEMLLKGKQAWKADGVFLVLDLYRERFLD